MKLDTMGHAVRALEAEGFTPMQRSVLIGTCSDYGEKLAELHGITVEKATRLVAQGLRRIRYGEDPDRVAADIQHQCRSTD